MSLLRIVGADPLRLNPFRGHFRPEGGRGREPIIPHPILGPVTWTFGAGREREFDTSFERSGGRKTMALWWTVPTFEQVEVWPGRGFLVTLSDGHVEFVRDLDARLPEGTEPDRRFWNPPPTLRRGEPAAGNRRPLDPHGTAHRDAARRRSARSNRLAIEVVEAIAEFSIERDQQLPYHDQDPRTRAHTSTRARSLLTSLLDARQRREFERLGHFWLHGPFGSVRLGRLYDIVHRSLERPDIERRLCVVTRAHAQIPPDDEWTSMVLTLAHDPDRFFRVANLRRESAETDVRHLRDALDGACRLGDPQHAIFLAADLGSVTGGRELDDARLWTRAHAGLDPRTRDRYLTHHAWIERRARSESRWSVPSFDFAMHRDLDSVAS